MQVARNAAEFAEEMTMAPIAALNSALFARLLVVTAFWVAAWSAPSQAEGASESLMPVHEAYTNGDFDEVLARIESYQKRYPRHSLADSLFIAKHLAVVYGSNPQTREKGRYFMFRMLEMNPSADLVDMFISQDLDQTFEKVRKEFMVRQSREQKVKTSYALPSASSRLAASPAPSTSAPVEKSERSLPIPVAKETPKEGGKTWLWFAGGAAVVAGAVTAYYLTLNESTPGENHVMEGQ